MSRPTGERTSKASHFHHASMKGHATALFRHGHLDKEQHDEIVKHAERGMAKAKKASEKE